MDLDSLPAQLRPVLNALASALRAREPAVRAHVERLRAEHPFETPDQIAQRLLRSTRRRVAATGAASSATAVIPGLGTLIALGSITSQSLYALEQETELVLAIAIAYGHELAGSDERLLEALLVVGIAGGAVKLRENVLVAGGERLTVAAVRSLPAHALAGPGSHLVARVLTRLLGRRAVGAVVRLAPVAVGMAAGAGFDWLAVTALGRAAIRYYGPGGAAVKALPAHREDGAQIESRH